MLIKFEKNEYKSFTFWRKGEDKEAGNVIYRDMPRSGEIIVILRDSGFTLSHYFNSIPGGHNIESFLGEFCDEYYLSEKLNKNSYVIFDYISICRDIKECFKKIVEEKRKDSSNSSPIMFFKETDELIMQQIEESYNKLKSKFEIGRNMTKEELIQKFIDICDEMKSKSVEEFFNTDELDTIERAYDLLMDHIC